MVRVTVMYPNNDEFNLNYYIQTHIPMVHDLLDPYGLIKVEVDKGLGTSEGLQAPYQIICHLRFDSIEKMQEGMKAHDAELAADVSNFCNSKPIIQISEILEF